MALRSTAFLDSSQYGFEWLRLQSEMALQEGVRASADLAVTAAAAGGLRVDVAAGIALIKGDSGTPGTGLSQGLYTQVNDAAVANAVTFATAHATLPRIDQCILTVSDSSDLGSAGNVPVLAPVTGTATSGATLDNRNGAAALPNNSLRLADVLIPAASTVVTAPNVRDRRTRARGQQLTATAGSVAIGTTDINIVGEFSGTPVRLDWAVVVQHENNTTLGSAKYGVYDVGQLAGDNEIAFGNIALVIATESGFYLNATPAAGYRTLVLRVFEVTGSTWNLNRASFMATERI